MPQAPQLFELVWRSRQLPLQQVVPAVQTVVQLPQWALSVCVLAQTPPQQKPDWQVLPQTPQLVALLWRFTQ